MKLDLCPGGECPLKEKCVRYTKVKKPYKKTFWFPPYHINPVRCDFYIVRADIIEDELNINIEQLANKINIPFEFKLKGKKIIVEFDNEMCNDESYLGEADFTRKVITLSDRNIDKSKVSIADQRKTFYHELMHMMLDACNRHRLKYNEDFVDEMGLLLYEFERTKK